LNGENGLTALQSSQQTAVYLFGPSLPTPMRLLAHWIITQRTIHVVLPNKPSVLRHDKLRPTAIKTLGSLLVARLKKAGLTQQKLAEMTGFHRQWLGRWERGRALPSPADWDKFHAVLSLPLNPTFQ